MEFTMTIIIIMCLIAAVVALGARLVSLEHRVDNLEGPPPSVSGGGGAGHNENVQKV